jgi:hypothetical protein
MLLLYLTQSIGCSRENKPVLAVDNPVFHFGQVVQGETLTHSFLLENTSIETVYIKSVRTSCTCTVVDESEGFGVPLRAGEKRSLLVSFDASGYRKEQASRIQLEYAVGSRGSPKRLERKGIYRLVAER